MTFDPDDLDAAYAELDRRFADGEAAAHGRVAAGMGAFVRAIAARDWGAMTAVLSPDLVVTDHRPLGWETMHGPAMYVASLGSLVDLAPDVRLRNDHMLLSDRAALFVNTWVGTREGGAFEAPRAVVFEFDAGGRIGSMDFYDPEQLAEARTRFEATGGTGLADGASRGISAATPPVERFTNAAWRAVESSMRAIAQRDWDALVALFAPEHVLDDRRSLMRMRVEGLAYFAHLRIVFEGFQHHARQLLATRGERLMLDRGTFTGASRDSGPAEFEMLSLIEVDAAGRRVAVVQFDPDDLDAAYAELDRRYGEGEAAPYAGTWEACLRLGRAAAARDWEQLASVFAPDLVMEDHRPLGILTMSRDAYVASVRALLDLRPDATLRMHHVIALDDGRSLAIPGWVGGEPEGMFEISAIVVTAYDGDGVRRRIDFYDPDQLDDARARYDELRPDPLRIPPNAASRAGARLLEAGETRDWDVVRALCAPALEFEDRRRGILTTGDREMYVASARYVFSRGRARVVRTVLATAGDRLLLEHILWTAAGDASPFEVETLSLVEVDAEGHIVAIITFDPDDRRAASVEMFERWARSDAARWIPPTNIEYRRALNARDLERVRAVLPDDFTFHDHRRLGAGRLDGVDSYVAWLAALFEQSPDAMIETLYYVATGPQGFVTVGRTFGTNAEGGEFESVFVQLGTNDGDRPVAGELFDLEDLDTALARFEALRPPHARPG